MKNGHFLKKLYTQHNTKAFSSPLKNLVTRKLHSLHSFRFSPKFKCKIWLQFWNKEIKNLEAKKTFDLHFTCSSLKFANCASFIGELLRLDVIHNMVFSLLCAQSRQSKCGTLFTEVYFVPFCDALVSHLLHSTVNQSECQVSSSCHS